MESANGSPYKMNVSAASTKQTLSTPVSKPSSSLTPSSSSSSLSARKRIKKLPVAYNRKSTSSYQSNELLLSDNSSDNNSSFNTSFSDSYETVSSISENTPLVDETLTKPGDLNEADDSKLFTPISATESGTETLPNAVPSDIREEEEENAVVSLRLFIFPLNSSKLLFHFLGKNLTANLTAD